jgi:hypothetical protein
MLAACPACPFVTRPATSATGEIVMRNEHAESHARRRRQFIGGALALALLPGPSRAAASRMVEVWKDPGCGCCNDWIAHLEANGYTVTAHDVGNTVRRAELGMPAAYGSCHTALVDGYVLEGHVPAGDVARLLRERPAALGLAVPGMPIGSPGMDAPAYGGRRDRYDVLLVHQDGGHAVYQSYAEVAPTR